MWKAQREGSKEKRKPRTEEVYPRRGRWQPTAECAPAEPLSIGSNDILLSPSESPSSITTVKVLSILENLRKPVFSPLSARNTNRFLDSVPTHRKRDRPMMDTATSHLPAALSTYLNLYGFVLPNCHSTSFFSFNPACADLFSPSSHSFLSSAL